MKKLNYYKLQPLSKNIPTNKSTNSEDSVDIMLGLMDYQSNFEEFIRNENYYDSTSILIADNDWLKRKGNNSFSKSISEGIILKTDFGKCYSGECAYIHFSLCVRVYRSKILVIPMTTSEKYVNKAYHPVDNKSGDYSLRLARPEDGFTSKGALFINDARFISIGRVIDAYANINPDALQDIKKHLFSVCLPVYEKEYVNLKNEVADLTCTIEKLSAENEKLASELKNLKKADSNSH